MTGNRLDPATSGISSRIRIADIDYNVPQHALSNWVSTHTLTTAALVVTMYDVSAFDSPQEVAAFQNDLDARIAEGQKLNWQLGPEWPARFQNHLEALSPVAKAGNAWAQYSIAVIYMLGLLHVNEAEAIKCSQSDVDIMSHWLERAARQGFVTAVDNLITNGSGTEAERLRRIFREVETSLGKPKLNSELSAPVYGPEYCEEVWRIAYGAG